MFSSNQQQSIVQSSSDWSQSKRREKNRKEKANKIPVNRKHNSLADWVPLPNQYQQCKASLIFFLLIWFSMFFVQL